jgi:hypothetical protein
MGKTIDLKEILIYINELGDECETCNLNQI